VLSRVRVVDRRWWAAVGLLAVVLAAVIVPVATRTYPGRPVAGPPIPGEPHVGDCLQFPPPHFANLGSFQDRLGPCGTAPSGGPAADRFGEVAAVLSDGATATQTLGTSTDTACSLPSRIYLGLNGQGLIAGAAFWSPAPTISYAVVEPTAQQKMTGQHWAACVVYATRVPTGGGPEQATPTSDRGTLQAAFNSAGVPTAAGLCASSTTAGSGAGRSDGSAAGDPTGGARYVDCTTPHNVEMLAFTAPASTSAQRRAIVTADCARLTPQLLHTNDPAAGGQLTVITLQLQTLDPNQPNSITLTEPPAASPDGGAGTATDVQDALTACLITPTQHGRQLTGSLLRIGDGPLPWA
jgi:hypothetical protein